MDCESLVRKANNDIAGIHEKLAYIISMLEQAKVQGDQAVEAILPRVYHDLEEAHADVSWAASRLKLAALSVQKQDVC